MIRIVSLMPLGCVFFFTEDTMQKLLANKREWKKIANRIYFSSLFRSGGKHSINIFYTLHRIDRFIKFLTLIH